MSAPGTAHDARRDDLAVYALGALRPTEATELERHLADCDACRAELRWLQPAVDVLPSSVRQLTPPRSLRKGLVATVRDEARRRAQAQGDASPWRSRRRLSWRPATALAGALLLAAGIGIGYLVQKGDGQQTVVAAATSGRAARATGTLDVEGGSATLSVDRMPPLRRDEVYEVWIQRDGDPHPASLFVLRTDGSGDAAVPGPLSGGDAVVVTREPRGGSSQPTSPPLMRAAIE